MREALEAVGLGDDPRVPDLYPFQMSGGMLQRAMIALALLARAPFLVADEPTTDLDLVAQARILDLLAAVVRDRGLGLLIVTHDLGVVARLADRMAVMADGRIVETDNTASVFARPDRPETRALLAAHRALHEARHDGPPVRQWARQSLRRHRVAPRRASTSPRRGRLRHRGRRVRRPDRTQRFRQEHARPPPRGPGASFSRVVRFRGMDLAGLDDAGRGERSGRRFRWFSRTRSRR